MSLDQYPVKTEITVTDDVRDVSLALFSLPEGHRGKYLALFHWFRCRV